MKGRGATGDSKWIRMFLLVMMSTGVVSGDLLYTIRAGDDVTLSCENVIKGHRNCDTTTWTYSKAGKTAQELVTHGQVKYRRSDPLSLAGNCSLVLRNISAEDAGLYICQQYEGEGGGPSHPDAPVYLSVVTLREQTEQNKVTFTCSVSPYDEWFYTSRHKVKWLFKGNDVEKDHPDIKTSSPFSCSAAVTFQTSTYVYSSRFNLFKCEVETENKQQLFTFSSGPTGRKTDTTESAGESRAAEQGWTWVYVGVGVATVALIIGLALVILKRNQVLQQKGPKHSSGGTTSDPDAAPCASEQEQVEAEGGIAYASISYSKKPNRSSREINVDADVTYSVVKAPPTDPNSLYASVVKNPKQ
uniref:Ig-like domain-containing protein n=2 Tax=Nothobranchius korthausae TaxID=1143690 RepID=A0A1A8EPE4_9TELE